MRVGLTNTDFATTETLISFTVDISNCPTAFTIGALFDLENQVTGASPIFYVIDETAALTKSFEFIFTPSPACPEVALEYKYSVNSTDVDVDDWATIDYTDGSGLNPMFIISTDDPLHTGLHTIKIWAQVAGSDPLVDSKDWSYAEQSLEFDVVMYNSYCLYGGLTPYAIPDPLTFVMASPSVPLEHEMDAWTWAEGTNAGSAVLDPFSDPYSTMDPLDATLCTARTYTLSGTAFDEGILTLAAETVAQQSNF